MARKGNAKCFWKKIILKLVDNKNTIMSIESTPVSSLMTRNVITQTEDQNVHAVSKTMHENNIGSVVIVKNKDRDNDISSSNKPIGIITERYSKDIRLTRTIFT